MTAQPSTAVEFQWDDRNVEHLARRDIAPLDIETVHRNAPRYYRNKRNAAGTWLMVGRDGRGRTLIVSVRWADEAERRLRAITGWPK